MFTLSLPPCPPDYRQYLRKIRCTKRWILATAVRTFHRVLFAFCRTTPILPLMVRSPFSFQHQPIILVLYNSFNHELVHEWLVTKTTHLHIYTHTHTNPTLIQILMSGPQQGVRPQATVYQSVQNSNGSASKYNCPIYQNYIPFC